MKQKGFFDENDRLEELSKMGDPLEKLNKFIQWEKFWTLPQPVYKVKQLYLKNIH